MNSTQCPLADLDPLITRLKAWLNPEYVQDFEQDILHDRRCHNQPFKYAILPDLFLPEVIQSIWQYCQTIPVTRADLKQFAPGSCWSWGAFDQAQVVRFIYSTPFQTFLHRLLREQLIMKSGAVPQYNRFQSSSAGIPIHNDTHAAIEVVSLLQLSQHHEPGFGGELMFYCRERGKFTAIEQIPPKLNTFVIFKVSPESYHSVADLHLDWIRENIAFDWSLCR